MARINGHGHLLPYPNQIPHFMKEKKIFWLDNNRKFMHQGEWKRPVTCESFFLKEKLEWMESHKIDHEVILTLSQLYCNGLERNLTNDVIRFQNDFNAEVQHQHPDKITSGFVVQPLHLDDALAEIDRCVNSLKLPMLCLPSHFLDSENEWISVANEAAFPIFELANELGIAVEIHPYDAPKMIKLKDEYWRFHLVWMCAQTADTYHMFTLQGLHERFPKMRTCFAHGNQFGQINVGRRAQGFTGRPDLFEGAVDPRDSVGVTNIYFDTLVHDVLSFNLLVQRQGVGQILAGLDDPYPLGEMDGIGDCYPGKVIEDAVQAGFISQQESEKIWYDHVLDWIGGAHAIKLRAAVN